MKRFILLMLSAAVQGKTASGIGWTFFCGCIETPLLNAAPQVLAEGFRDWKRGGRLLKTTKNTVQKKGFRGFYHPAEPDAGRAILVLIGDEGNDFLDNACARWLLTKHSCSALCIAVRQREGDDTGLHEWPLEYIEAGVRWLKKQGVSQIGILGVSMQACLALTAASLIPDISLTIAFAPCDFIPWGFHQGRRNRECPSGTSAFSWRGEGLSFQPACLSEEDYWKMYCDTKKQFGEMHSRSIFEYSEKAHPIRSECFIPIENIRGHVVLVGAEDDSMWDSAGYIHRMEKRGREKGCTDRLETCLYRCGTHLLLPEQMLKAGPFRLGGIAAKLFVSGRKNAAQCRTARRDVEKRLTETIRRWGEQNDDESV